MSIEDCFRRSMNKARPNASYCCCRAPELRRENPELSQHDAFREANKEWRDINA
ncbi:MAG: hypothetical protein M1113_05720 [Candidatus Thermoplasmatota archaeon]|nr:hypothetical protein [Candidatus Thermoplasmatota archaeon]